MTHRRPETAPRPPHPDAAQCAISCELVRLTLGGRGPQRSELRVDALGRLANAGKRLVEATRPLREWAIAAEQRERRRPGDRFSVRKGRR